MSDAVFVVLHYFENFSQLQTLLQNPFWHNPRNAILLILQKFHQRAHNKLFIMLEEK